MDLNPLALALQDCDSAAPMAVDDQAMPENLRLNSRHILNDHKFISPDSITRNPNEEDSMMEFDENPFSSSEMASNFRVWDLNTENSELEHGTLMEILTSILAQTEDCLSYDALDLLSCRSPGLSVDAFSFSDMKSALDEHNVDRLSAILGGLGISVSGDGGNTKP